MQARASIPFAEVQRFTADQWAKVSRFFCVLLGLLFVTMVPIFLALNREGLGYVIAALATVGLVDGLVFATLFRVMELRVEERPEGLLVHFHPLPPRTIPYADIHSVAAQPYNAKRRRGWGYSVSPKETMFSVSGRACVELLLRNGKRVVIGTQRPEELAAAIDRHLPDAGSAA